MQLSGAGGAAYDLLNSLSQLYRRKTAHPLLALVWKEALVPVLEQGAQPVRGFGQAQHLGRIRRLRGLLPRAARNLKMPQLTGWQLRLAWRYLLAPQLLHRTASL